MKVRQQFPHLPSIRFRSSEIDQLESLLDLVPGAAILVDIKKQVILLANPHFAELSSFTRKELSGKSLVEVIPDFSPLAEGEHGLGESPVMDCTLRSRPGQEIESRAELTPIDEQGVKAVIRLTPKSQIAQNRSSKDLESNRWEALRVLVLAAEHVSSEAAVAQILQSAWLLTGSGIIGVYTQDTSDNKSLVSFYLSDDSGLPEKMALSEISHLQVPFLWEPGERSVSILHSKAITERFAYLASVPIDQSDPLNGILVAGDRHQGPHHDILPILNLIASSLSIHLLPQQAAAENLSEPPFELASHKTHHLDRIFDALDEGLILFDRSLRVLSINLAAESILGVRSAEMVGQKAEDILISSPSITSGLIEVLEGTPVWKLDSVNLKHRKGHTIPAALRVLSLSGEGDEDALAVIFTDLSDEEQYRARAQQLEQQAFLGEVSAIFAHEVRNPINNISTGLELMSMELAENESVQDQILRIQDDFERLTDLMKSVLSFSGRREYQIMQIDLVTMIDKILDRWRVRAPQNNISFHLSPPQEPAVIEGDQRAIEQVLTNLISNSVKAMEETGGDLTVKFNASQDETGTNFIEILISDTGPGIPGEVIDHIFEPFYTTKKEGTGLGLAISKRIVEAHKGKISAQSFPGMTIFKVALPAIGEHEADS